MTITRKQNRAFRTFPLTGMSMQKRLPLLICVLLFGVMAAFCCLSYFGVRNAALKIGMERLNALTGQLSTLFGQSGQTVTSATRTAAGQQPLISYMRSGNTTPDTIVSQILMKLRPDSTWVITELLNESGKIMYQSALPGRKVNIDRRVVLSSASLLPDSCRIGNMYVVNDSIYYPVVAAITDNKQIIGYLIRWRLQLATPKSIAQFSQLLGSDAKLIVGNADGSLWTDLNKPVHSPSGEFKNLNTSVSWTQTSGEKMFGSIKKVTNTPWAVLVGFPKKIVLAPARNFLQGSIIVGAIVLAIGFFIALIVSRNITSPVNKLTTAASLIASGDFSHQIEVGRSDEIGKLARAFNAMRVQIAQSQLVLENKVSERTTQLEQSNKEMEAFSYSVSHDLRAPLRIIDGYAKILSEDHSSNLDQEGQRLLGIISENAKKMGVLIDDLLNLSRLGKKTLLIHHVEMTELVKKIIEELGSATGPTIKIADLHNTFCDSNLIRQVWVNLVSNGIKYSAKKEFPVIEISSEQKGNEIIYCVKDNGVGFDMKYAHKLFGVFQRLHGMNEFDGTGVGLALVQRIILKHGGKVWAEAEKDKGASFYFTLPIKQPIAEPGSVSPQTNYYGNVISRDTLHRG